jgi:hypothetical protein
LGWANSSADNKTRSLPSAAPEVEINQQNMGNNQQEIGIHQQEVEIKHREMGIKQQEMGIKSNNLVSNRSPMTCRPKSVTQTSHLPCLKILRK